MRLKKEVSNFSASCEHLMAEVETSRTLTEEETLLVEFYCREVLKKIVKRPPSQGERAHPDLTSLLTFRSPMLRSKQLGRPSLKLYTKRVKRSVCRVVS